jgi:hypothetical protein
VGTDEFRLNFSYVANAMGIPMTVQVTVAAP